MKGAPLAFSVLLAASPASAAPKPIAKGPWVQHVTAREASVRIEVDPPAPVTLDVDGRTFESKESVSLHAIPLVGLKPATQYPYTVRVGATAKAGAFVTAPADDSSEPFRFLVYGDNRTDDAAHAAVVRAMTPIPADFLVHTGDLVEDGGSLANWQTFFDIEAPLLGARGFFSAVGNHELTDGSGIHYARYFGPRDVAPKALKPEHLDGTFRWGSARFFLVNSMVHYKGTAERAWLEKALGDADGEANLKWRIVVLHHGPWSSGPHGNNARLHDAGIVAMLKAHRIDIVFSGHDHLYDRGLGDGLPYVVTGGGGAPVYKVKTPIPESRKLESVRHFVEVSVTPEALSLTAKRLDGSTLERCGLSKATPGWDCDPPSVSAPKPAARSRCGCDVVGARSADSAWWILVVLSFVVRRILRRCALPSCSSSR